MFPVMYSAGSYGSYLQWLLKMMFTSEEVYEPFNARTGDSHNLRTKSELKIKEWLKDNNNFMRGTFIKVHPKIDEAHSLEDNINSITEYFGKSILIYPSKKTYLLHCNNFIYKLAKNMWVLQLRYFNLDNLYDNYPVSRDIPPDQVSPWIIREILSFNFFNSMNSQIEWYLPDSFANKNCLVIFIDDILYDTEHTLERIRDFIEMPFTKSFDMIAPLHEKNMLLQKYLGQDELANKILTAVINNDESFSWNREDLTLISESWIQKSLKENGYDLKCWNLNQFPESISELMKFL